MRWLGLTMALTLMAAACGTGDEGESSTTTVGEPNTTATSSAPCVDPELAPTIIDKSVGYPWQTSGTIPSQSIEQALDGLVHCNGQVDQVQCKDCGKAASVDVTTMELSGSNSCEHPTAYDPDELVAQIAEFTAAADDAGIPYEDVTPVLLAGQDLTYQLPEGIGIFSVQGDPISVIETLNLLPGLVAPNYIYLPAPGWRFSPADEPVPSSPDALIAPDQELGDGTVVVIDDFGSDHGPMVHSIVDQLLAGSSNIVDLDAADITIDPTSQSDFEFGWEHPTDATVAAQIEAAATVESDTDVVINLSMGTYPCELSDALYWPLLVDSAIASLPETVHVVAAAGNDSHDDGDPVFYPAGSPLVTSVGALAWSPDEDDWVMAEFSNVDEVDRWAPGVAVVGEGTSNVIAWSGTSFAAPHVSACIAAEACTPVPDS